LAKVSQQKAKLSKKGGYKNQKSYRFGQMRSKYIIYLYLVFIASSSSQAWELGNLSNATNFNISEGCLDALKLVATGSYPDEFAMLSTWGKSTLNLVSRFY